MARARMPMMPTGWPAAPPWDGHAHDASTQRVLVVLPTYTELLTLPFVIEHVLAAVPHAYVLVVDDDSPDGTGVWAEEHARSEPHLRVLHRRARCGLGSAYKAGFAWGLDHGFDVLCAMDSDGRHDPCALPSLLAAIDEGADLVLGSRYVERGATRDGRLSRRLLSSTSHLVARRLLGLAIRDATSGFRAYRADLLRAIDVGNVVSDGYAFQLETLWRAARAGGRIVERPIVFRDRRQGQSTISRREVVRAALTLLRLRRQGGRPATLSRRAEALR